MISVIIPIYNTEKYLCQCLDSVLNQSFQALEIILIDDGSPDRCGAICDAYAATDPRIRVLHTENRGLSAARNLGLKEASGEYIAFLDSDDWIDAEAYEQLLAGLQRYDADICACGRWLEYTDGAVREGTEDAEEVYTPKEAIRAMLSGDIRSSVNNKLYRRECFDGVFFPEGRVFEDIATTHRVILQAKKTVFLAAPLYHLRKRKGSITQTYSFQNLWDLWQAYYGRCLELSEHDFIRDDVQTVAKLHEQLARVALRVWRCMHEVPAAERDPGRLKAISACVGKQFPPFGERNWKPTLRAGIFFVRFPNTLSFWSLRVLSKAFKIFHKREKLYV